MRTYSIYQKPCPACGAVVSVDIRNCHCGYDFDSESKDERRPEEQALQDEELFQAYLQARIDQAVEAVESARAEFTAEKSNRRNTEKLILAVQEALALRDEREVQMLKIAQLRESMPSNSNMETPSLSAQPTEAFRAQESAKAEKIMASFANTQTKTCPHCETVLPVTSALCLCGFIYARNDFMLPRAVDRSTRGDIYRTKE
jgi:vacuolar-type H+-ATPase subunit I/STV1